MLLHAPDTVMRSAENVMSVRGKLGEEIVGEIYKWLQPARLRIERHKKAMQLNQ